MSKTRHKNTGNSEENCGNRKEKHKQKGLFSVPMSATQICKAFWVKFKIIISYIIKALLQKIRKLNSHQV